MSLQGMLQPSPLLLKKGTFFAAEETPAVILAAEEAPAGMYAVAPYF